jgi:cytochrome c553
MAGFILLLALSVGSTPANDLAFFEAKVRPLLVEKCYKCHSEEARGQGKLRGGLLLDSRPGWAKGGDSGAAIISGKPDASLLIDSLAHTGELKMPPAGKLTDQQIADLKEWVRRGAPDPREGKKSASGTREITKPWWSAPPAPLSIPLSGTTQAPIDQLVRARLQSRGLKHAAPASAEVLARRLAFDLTGLPPDATLLASLRDNMSADNIALEVDRLLASRAYAERWARHWFDVARYAESLTLRGFIFKDAWRYRDAVIAAFASDMPFDQFVAEQIAGDLMTGGTSADRERRAVLTSFLLMGNTNLEEQDKKTLDMDFIDEQLDVIGKGLLAQTITCARCHDHKFDPIPARDYHALAGILKNAQSLEHANVSKWVEVPLPLPLEQEKAVAQAEAHVQRLKSRIAALKKTGGPKSTGIVKPGDLAGIVVDDMQARQVGMWMASVHSGSYIGSGYLHDQNAEKGKKTLTFQAELPSSGEYEVRLAYSHGTSRATAVPVTVFSADGEQTISVNMSIPPAIDGRFVSLGKHKFEKSGQSFVIVSTEQTMGHVTADAVVFLPVSSAAKTQKLAGDTGSLGSLEQELKRFEESMPKRPMTMGIRESAKPVDSPVFIRGNVRNPGPLAPRGFLTAATWNGQPSVAPNSGGRRELAAWIGSASHPLTSRVMANRIWSWLMGEGIVRSVDNFGVMGEKPDDAALLDYLATRLSSGDWSVKQVVREVVLSQTYQQASGEEGWSESDPDNRFYGRARVRRLEAECLHDAILSIAGTLEPCQGGPTFAATLASDQGYQQTGHTRAVYLPAFRNAPHELLQAFDQADPSSVTGHRDSGTVVQQALYLTNNAWVLEQAGKASSRLLKSPPGERADLLWKQSLGRQPTDRERAIVASELATGTGEQSAWARICRALWSSAEFRRLD